MEFLFIDFVNSQWYNTHKTYAEPLKDPKWMGKFLDYWNIQAELELTEDNLRILLDLRMKITHYIEKIFYYNEINQKDVDQINNYLGLSKVKRKLIYCNGEYTSQLIPITRDIKWIISEIAASFVKFLAEYDNERIRICENPDCRWVFYDESRSRTRRWCDSKCGNLMKVRRFREKQKNK